MEGGVQDVENPDSVTNDVSGPLDIRRLQGHARCSRCRQADRDCYLERGQPGNLRCVTCYPKFDCRFRRVVLREDDASKFTWEELIKDDVAANIPVAAVSTLAPPARTAIPTIVVPQKRTYASFYGSDRPSLPVHHTGFTSMGSEPASQIRTHLSSSPLASRAYPTHEFATTADPSSLWVEPNLVELPDVVNNDLALVGIQWGNTYVPGQRPLDERQNSVSHNLELASYQLEEFTQTPWVGTPDFTQHERKRHKVKPTASSMPTPVYARSSEITGERSWHLRGYRRSSETPVSDAQDKSGRFQFMCRECDEVLNTKSELRKHMDRHQKPFACDIPGCPRGTEGFATRNDLDRHKAGVHGVLERGVYEFKCNVSGCKDPSKIWLRKDNFKAHIKRMHPDEDVDAIVESSMIRGPGGENT